MNGRSVLSDVSFAPAELTIWFSLFSLLVWRAPFLEAADSVEASYVGQAQSLWLSCLCLGILEPRSPFGVAGISCGTRMLTCGGLNC